MDPLIQNSVSHFEAFYNGSPWYGSNYITIMGSITEEEANWWPANGHSIHRLLLHMIKWRKALTERLLGNLYFRASDADADNWPDAEAMKQSSWEETKKEFARQQELLVSNLKTKNDSFLEEDFLPGKKFGWLVQGVIDHDIYHLGQIAFLRTLIRTK